MNILAKQSKKDYVVKIKKNQLTITNMILNDNYFISQIDVWLLCHVNKFPVVLYASDNYLSMQLPENYIITSEELETNKFLCIYFDNSVTEQSFDSSISIIEPSIDGSKLLENNMKIVGLKQHLRKYKMNLVIKK